jgi:hypothetical protein
VRKRLLYRLLPIAAIGLLVIAAAVLVPNDASSSPVAHPVL